jgi:hypothetical protein
VIRAPGSVKIRKVRDMADDIRMLDWWNGLSEREHQVWCASTGSGKITSGMLNTVPVEHQGRGPNEWLTLPEGVDVADSPAQWSLASTFKRFINRQCHP